MGIANKAANAERPVVVAPPVATFNGNRARTEDLREGLALSVECDERPREALTRLAGIIGPPTVTVASGGVWINPETGEEEDKLHLHWRLSEPTRTPEEHAALRRARELACRLVGADSTSIAAVHPMRWPGTWHRKRAPRLATIRELNPDHEIHLQDALDELEGILALRGEHVSGWPTHTGPSSKADDDILAAVAERLTNPLPPRSNGELPRDSWDDWNKVSLAFWAASSGSESAFLAFDEFSSRHPAKYDAAATRARWNHYRISPPSRIGIGYLIAEARRCDPSFRSGNVGQGEQPGEEKPEGEAIEGAKAIIEAAIKKAQEGDPGAPFEPAVIGALRLIVDHDRAQFMRYRSQFKKANRDILITELDHAIRGAADTSAETESIADMLVAMVQESADLFHDSDRTAYATFVENGHRETWPLESTGFREWLSARFYRETGKAPREASVKDAIGTLAGIAKFDGPEHKVWLRVARQDGRYYIDLCNGTWQAVEVGPDGWQILDHPPVRFRRTPTMKALPTPIRGGDIQRLWDTINVPDPDDRLLVLAYLLECWRPDTPFPVLEKSGEQGSGKSDTADRLRSLIDPSEVNLRAAPKAVEDVFIAAANNWCVCFNNLSHLSAHQQDAFCSLTERGGFAGRTLYTKYRRNPNRGAAPGHAQRHSAPGDGARPHRPHHPYRVAADSLPPLCIRTRGTVRARPPGHPGWPAGSVQRNPEGVAESRADQLAPYGGLRNPGGGHVSGARSGRIVQRAVSPQVRGRCDRRTGSLSGRLCSAGLHRAPSSRLFRADQ